MKTWLAAVVVFFLSVRVPAAEVSDVAPEIIATLMEFDPLAVHPDAPEPLFAPAVVRKQRGGFHIEIQGNYYDSAHTLLVAICGDPLKVELASKNPSLQAQFRNSYLLYFPEREATVIFGFGSYLPEQVTRDRRNAPPVIVSRVKPRYPYDLHARGIEGRVLVGFRVDSVGVVRDAYIIESSHEELSVAALSAIAHWQYLPALVDGRPVTAPLQVAIEFKLTENPEKSRPRRGRGLR